MGREGKGLQLFCMFVKGLFHYVFDKIQSLMIMYNFAVLKINITVSFYSFFFILT